LKPAAWDDPGGHNGVPAWTIAAALGLHAQVRALVSSWQPPSARSDQLQTFEVPAQHMIFGLASQAEVEAERRRLEQWLYRPALQGYACGWRVEATPRGTACVQHGGGVMGYACQLTRLLEEDVVVVVLGNDQGDPGKVADVVLRTLEGDLTEVRMSDEILQATLTLHSFLFEAVYENPRATAEFEKAAGLLGGLWDKVRARPGEFLDEATIAEEGLDAAARDFLAGMTDRYAVSLFSELFVPRSWSV